MERRRFLLALVASMALHLTLLASPGWRVPTLEDLLLSGDEAIEARLAPLPRPAAVPKAGHAARPAAPRRPLWREPSPPPAAEAPVAEPAPAMPAPALEPPPPAEPAAAVVEAEAVPAEVVAQEIALPRQGRIRFLVRKGEDGFIIGRAVHEWRHDGASYTLTSTAETTGLVGLFRPARVTQVSEGEVAGGGMRPREFRVERNGVVNDRARFDWAAGRIVLAGGARELPLAAGSQDMLSLAYQLGLMALAPEGSGLSVATGSKLERYTVTAVGEENVEVPAGGRRALHVVVRGAVGVEATEVWLGLDDHRLPLRIRHVDRKGDSYDQVAEIIQLEETR